jgi:hypothetical protein
MLTTETLQKQQKHQKNQQIKLFFESWFMPLCSITKHEEFFKKNPLVHWNLNEIIRQIETINFMFQWWHIDWTSKKIQRQFRKEVNELQKMIYTSHLQSQKIKEIEMRFSDEAKNQKIILHDQLLCQWELVKIQLVNPIPDLKKNLDDLNTKMFQIEIAIQEYQIALKMGQQVSTKGNFSDTLKTIQVLHDEKHQLAFQIGRLTENLKQQTEMYCARKKEFDANRSKLEALVHQDKLLFDNLYSSIIQQRYKEIQLAEYHGLLNHKKLEVETWEQILSKKLDQLVLLQKQKISLGSEFVSAFQNSPTDDRLNVIIEQLSSKNNEINAMMIDVARARESLETSTQDYQSFQLSKPE